MNVPVLYMDDDESMRLEWELLQESDEDYDATMLSSEDSQMLYEELVACKQLLGIEVAFMVLVIIWVLMQFFYKLITHNITNQF